MRCRPSLRRAAVPALLVTVAACGGGDPESTGTSLGVPASTVAGTTASDMTASDTTAAGTTPASGVVPVGFGTIAARVTAASGATCDVCLWLADTADLRSRGLMGVTDLGGRDGMAFRYDEPRTGAFTMRDTLLPLSIVFYAADGSYLDAFDMEPCAAEPCPSYPTPADFTVAVEVPAGGLDALLMSPGSTIELLDLDCAPR